MSLLLTATHLVLSSSIGTVSLANWMAHHPGTRWFSNRQMGFPKRSQRGRDAKSDTSDYTIFQEDMVVGPDGTYGFTSSPANDSTCLIDCEVFIFKNGLEGRAVSHSTLHASLSNRFEGISTSSVEIF